MDNVLMAGNPFKPRLTPLKLAFIYAVVGALWIFFSDELLATFVHNTTTYKHLEMLQGWFYVFATALLLYILVHRSISTYKQAEERVGHLNRVLRAIRNVDQILVREKDRSRLLQGICDNLIENRGYYNAWIALLDESGGLVTTSEAGLGKEFLPMLNRLKSGKLAQCAHKALAQSELVVTKNPISACQDCPLSTKYADKGAMTVRLEYEGKVYGILCASIPRELAVEEEEQGLVQEVAGDIAFGLNKIEQEKAQRQAEEALRRSTHDLGERIKELNCLFAVSRLAQKRRLSLEKVLRGIVDLIPPAWQYPEITCARIVLEGQEYRTANFRETLWKQISDIIVHGEDRGILEVYYLEERPESDEGPFQKEEKNLINAIAERLGKIIERKGAEKALRESEKRFRDLIENSLTGISIVRDNQVVYQNPEQERILGPLPRSFRLSELEGIHPEDGEKVKKFHQRIISGEEQTLDTDFKFYSLDKAGSRIDMKWVYCRTSSIEYEGKEALLVNMMDITRSKEMEQLLRIQDKMASLGRVAAGIAHEIRNPLSGINVYLNTLVKIYNRAESLDKIKQILGQVQSASNKIESVIRRVMDFSKPSAPKFVLTDINKPIEDAIKLSSVTFRKRGIRIEKTLAEDLPPCQADAHLIEQVVLNLITNAAEAMKEMDGDKKIEVTSSVENDRIQVRVSDSGTGVSPEHEDKIFDPFYGTKNGSTGIGLSIARRIITDHGGTLSVSRSKWGGAEFIIEIPLEKGKDE